MLYRYPQTLLVIVYAVHQLFAEEVRIRMDNIVTIEGNDIILKCTTETQTSKVSWFKLGVNGLRNLKEINLITYSLLDNGDLIIQNLDPHHAGEYLCSYETAFGVEKHVTSLVVKIRTKAFIEHDKPIKGQRIAVRCKVTVDPSLTYKIDWKFNKKEIDFKNEPNIIRKETDTLIIRDARFDDSGTYTCVVTTHFKGMNNAITAIVLNVRDVPKAPHIKKMKCTPLEAEVVWESNVDNDNLKYAIEAKSVYNPNEWIHVTSVPAIHRSKQSMRLDLYSIERLGWVNYTCRVIAHNDIGSSPPSEPTVEICRSKAVAPIAYVKNIKAIGKAPRELFISWDPMPPHMHFGPNFYYVLRWKRSDTDEVENVSDWSQVNITDWTQNNMTIDGLQPFTRYEVHLKCANQVGENFAKQNFIVYSGADKPSTAPTKFAVANEVDGETVILRWDPVPPESVNGNLTLSHYVIHIWNDVDGREKMKVIAVGNETCQTTITELRRFTVHYAQIFVENSLYAGPKSEILEFKTPLPDPSSVQSIEAHPLGSTAFLLKWTKPLQCNGQLTGFKIYYANETNKYERNPWINDSEATQAKLNGLNPNSSYRLYITPITNSIDGKDFFIHATTSAPKTPTKPDRPSFSLKILRLSESNVTIRINWIPDLTGNPGSHFFAKYRSKREVEWIGIDAIYEEDYVMVNGLSRGKTYEFQIVSIDGDLRTESDVQEMFFGTQSSQFDDHSTIFIILAVVALSFTLVLGITLLFLHRRAKKKALQERQLHFYSSSQANENLYQMNH